MLPIVDPHIHLWDAPAWDKAGDRYLFPGLLADMNDGHDVRANVQCRAMYRSSGPEELQGSARLSSPTAWRRRRPSTAAGLPAPASSPAPT